MEATHSIGMDKNFAWSAIKDQAGGWKQAIREGGQNGLDAPGSSNLHIRYNEGFSLIRDDGNGRDFSDPEERRLFLDLGATTKKGDDSTVGEFGIGKGQIWAIGVTKIVSGRQALIYDVKRRGIDDDAVIQVTLPEEHKVDGTMVVVYHYDGQVPSKGSREWDRYYESIKNRFRYTSKTLGDDVYVNDDLVSDSNVEEVIEDKSHSVYVETENAYIAIYQSRWDDISVYSNGVYVKDIAGEGFGGHVVTKENLSLDIARNDIKEDCSLWDTIKDELDDAKISLIKDIEADKRNKKVRKTAVKMMNESESICDELKKEALFQLIDGKLLTLTQIRRKSRIAFSDDSDIFADKVVKRGEYVLNEDDRATEVLQEDRDYFSCPNKFDIQRVAIEEYSVEEGYTIINDLELSTWERRRLGVARAMVEHLHYTKYDIFWGEDEESLAWTDGESYIAITEDIFESSSLSVWLPKLFRTLIHEISHDESTKGSMTHNRKFKTKFHDTLERKESLYDTFAEKVEDRGVSEFEVQNTKFERERIQELHETLRTLSEKEEFYKNRDKRCCTVMSTSALGVTFKGPRGGIWEIDILDSTEVPIARRPESGSEQKITHIKTK